MRPVCGADLPTDLGAELLRVCCLVVRIFDSTRLIAILLDSFKRF